MCSCDYIHDISSAISIEKQTLRLSNIWHTTQHCYRNIYLLIRRESLWQVSNLQSVSKLNYLLINKGSMRRGEGCLCVCVGEMRGCPEASPITLHGHWITTSPQPNARIAWWSLYSLLYTHVFHHMRENSIYSKWYPCIKRSPSL